MSKKKTTHIKDPKKVAAGKARAAKSLRIGGRFTSNEFFNDVKKQAEQAGVKDVLTFYKQNENEYQALYSTWMQSAEYFDYTFINILKDYTGTIIINGREVTAGTAIQKILKFNQFLKNNHSVVSWSIKPYLKLSGGLKFDLPTDEQMEENGEDIEDFLEGKGFRIIISEKKGRKQKKEYKLASRKGKYKKVEIVKNETKAKPKTKAKEKNKKASPKTSPGRKKR